jgi:spore germination cell wall hydrolase CwlJ-like protein
VTTAPLKTEETAPRYEITPEELDLVARVVHAEAAGEGYDGQALVAQCILNTAEATGKRPDEVVLEPKQYAAPAKEASDEVKEAVTAVFLDGYEVTAEPVRYFYAPARIESEWHETALDFVLEHGGHRFFKQ